MPSLDTRPGKLDVYLRPGNAFTLNLVWPAALTGRSFTASVDGTALTVSVNSATVSVTFSAVVTAALTGNPVWKLTETTSGTQVRIVGRAMLSTRGTNEQDATVSVSVDETDVAVTVLGEPGVSATSEVIQDVLGAMVVAGTNITVTYNDVAGTLTIDAAAGGGLTQEQTEDIVAALIDDNSDLDWTYDDGTGSLVAVIKPLAVTNAMLAGSIALSKLLTDPLARANHTGAQAISTVTGLQAALDGKETAGAAATVAAGAVNDGDTAGGVLAGTYPSPSFAVDMATQAELNAEAALARNADNLTSGTVADARIPSTIARDSEVTAAIDAVLDGATFTGDIVVPDEAYDATAWNGSLEVPTKNAVRDKIETLGGGSAELLTSLSHAPSGPYTSTTTAAKDVDATNLTVTFTVPASGAVLARLTTPYLQAPTTNQAVVFMLRDTGGTLVTGSDSDVLYQFGSLGLPVSYAVRITGLTPSASLTWRWGWSQSGTNTATLGNGSSTRLTMEIWAA